MPIQPNTMLAVELEAAHWDWLSDVLPALNVPMQPRDTIMRLIQGQLRAHLARVAAADELEAKAQAQPPAAVVQPKPPRAERRRAAAAAKKLKT